MDYDNDGVPDLIMGYGTTGDSPVSGDWNGDGKDKIGVFRNGVWFLDYDNNGTVDKIMVYGITGDSPISGDWYKI